MEKKSQEYKMGSVDLVVFHVERGHIHHHTSLFLGHLHSTVWRIEKENAFLRKLGSTAMVLNKRRRPDFL